MSVATYEGGKVKEVLLVYNSFSEYSHKGFLQDWREAISRHSQLRFAHPLSSLIGSDLMQAILPSCNYSAQ
jgi:hypothetical protein